MLREIDFLIYKRFANWFNSVALVWCRVVPCIQGHTAVGWSPGQETSLAPPGSNL